MNKDIMAKIETLANRIQSFANIPFFLSLERIQIKNPGRYLNLVLVVGLVLFLALLLGACSSPTAVDQPTSLAAELNGQSPTPTIQAPATLLTPTIEPTPFENIATPPPTAQPVVETEQPRIGSSRISEIDQMEQMYVPAGEFIMGSDDTDAKKSLEGGRAYPEIPVHTVYLDGYWIDKYEVTNDQYALCVEAGACLPPFTSGSYTREKYFGVPEFSNYPVLWVEWTMAQTYCEWAGRRLPTEAEWEKAARGTDARRYPWGNDPLSGERANFCDIDCPMLHANGAYNDGYPDTAPVGSFPAGASPYGAMDMAGNAWEWTSTLVQPYPYDASDGREDPESTGERVWRGGPWSNGVWWMRSALRYRSAPFYRHYNLGFRCASSP